MQQLTESEVRALITLLGDSDEWTAGVARDRLLDAGPRAVTHLQRAANENDIRLRVRARGVLESIRLSALADKFRAYAYRPDYRLELLEGALLVAEIGYPELDRLRCQNHLASLEQQLRAALYDARSPYEEIAAINRLLFVYHDFRGDNEQYYNPDNSFINRVLERQRGIPITLSLVYIELAQRVGIQMSGVGLPGHFLVHSSSLDDLFVDPFRQGRVLTRDECLQFLDEAGYGRDEKHLRSVRVRSIIARMLVNLVQIYSQLEDHERASRLTEYFNIVLRRDSAD